MKPLWLAASGRWMRAPLSLQLLLSAMVFLPALVSAVLHCRDRHLFVELENCLCSAKRVATASLETRSVALRYRSLRLSTHSKGLVRMWGPGFLCSSQHLQLQRDTKPWDGVSIAAAEALQHMGSLPEAGTLPGALVMC